MFLNTQHLPAGRVRASDELPFKKGDRQAVMIQHAWGWASMMRNYTPFNPGGVTVMDGKYMYCLENHGLALEVGDIVVLELINKKQNHWKIMS